MRMLRQTRLAAELGRSVERALVELAGKEAAGANTRAPR